MANLIPGINSNIRKGISNTNFSKLVDFDINNLSSSLRSRNIPSGAEALLRTSASASFVTGSAERDWRVSLSVPSVPSFTNSPILAPLAETGNKLIFPYSPTIIMSHSANYNATNPTHTNYTYSNFVSSQVDAINLTGDFTVENEQEGVYWIAMLHYLRSVSKMFYGENDPNAGNPPPVVKLNGYGDYVFNNVPVVIQNFTVDLQPDVDYIACASGAPRRDPQDETGENFITTLTNRNNNPAMTWVPTRSTLSVTVQPIYSRKSVAQFSLSDFVNGSYVENGKGFI
jgi:hypothetical protein|tara:strand:- start:21653 stop:22510 length:858 start_codon:yes stop_codon:yes gene_type:complete